MACLFFAPETHALVIRGLEYLHEHCVPPVVHRDLKVSNILLDGKFNAKVMSARPTLQLTRTFR